MLTNISTFVNAGKMCFEVLIDLPSRSHIFEVVKGIGGGGDGDEDEKKG